MKKKHILKYIISIGLLFVFIDGFSQKQKESEIKKDTVVYKTGYGFRIGVDISKPIKSLFDSNYNGFEIVGDYRISKNWYVASELGYEKNTTSEDFTNSTSKGSYIKLGANYNTYKNWLNMNNEIFIGMRYGFSIFDQTLNNYIPNVNNTYFPTNQITIPITATDLYAHWAEFQLGIKAETLKNLFISVSVSYKIMLSVSDPKNFKALYAPGFNRIYQSNTGFGFNYTLSYLIPFINK